MFTPIEQARHYIAELARKDGEIIFSREVIAGCWDYRNDVQTALCRFQETPTMTTEQKLISDLAEVSADLADWAKDLMLGDGKTASEVFEMLRDAIRIAGRD